MTRSVVVLGGGIGGLSAAHELAERGFGVPDSTANGSDPLPGEHGFRFFVDRPLAFLTSCEERRREQIRGVPAL